MEALRDHFERFCRLLALAERCLSSGDLASAIGVTRTAVQYVFISKCLFASPRLERLLVDIGRQIPWDPPPKRRTRLDGPRRILHVLTHAQPIGGDSRYVWRWMQRDEISQHSVAITSQEAVQESFDIPEVFYAEAKRSGGFVHALRSPISRPLEQVRELRNLCQDMDVVALHLYPYDIIPVLALASGCDSSRTILINHADHGFWSGASVSHSVVHLRKQSEAFIRQKRGLDPARSAILPIPIVVSPPKMSREQAKRALGFSPDTMLLLTVATPFKFSAPGQIGFLDLVMPVLSEHPEARLVAVGPDAIGEWRFAGTQTNGRVLAQGIRSDTDVFYSAADVYLDSVPFSSITSLLEAGSRGLPLLGYRLPDPELALMGPGAPGLEDSMIMATDPGSYRSVLGRLITDATFRNQTSAEARNRIVSLHAGAGWTRALDSLYEQLERVHDRGCVVAEHDRFESGSLNSALVHLYSKVPSSARKYTRAFIGPLPYAERLRITWQLWRSGLEASALNVLPPPVDRILHGLARRLKRTVRRLLER